MQAITLSREWVQQSLPRPHKNAHKGDKGTLNVLAGSHRYRGAAVLCTNAALRAGTGLVRLVSTSEVCAAAAAHPCVILEPVRQGTSGGIGIDGAHAALAGRPTALLAGCGMGAGAEIALLVQHLLRHATVPLVLDADALNALAGHTARGDNPAQRRRLLALLQAREAPTILTPHAGEMGRLAGRPTGDITEHQAQAAAEFAAAYGCVVVLKNYLTTVASPDGQVYQTNGEGNPGLATGGSGDVLAGITGSLLAQGMPPAEGAAAAVWLHAASAALLAGQDGYAGLSPAGLPAALAEVLHTLGR